MYWISSHTPWGTGPVFLLVFSFTTSHYPCSDRGRRVAVRLISRSIQTVVPGISLWSLWDEQRLTQPDLILEEHIWVITTVKSLPYAASHVCVPTSQVGRGLRSRSSALWNDLPHSGGRCRRMGHGCPMGLNPADCWTIRSFDALPHYVWVQKSPGWDKCTKFVHLLYKNVWQ